MQVSGAINFAKPLDENTQKFEALVDKSHTVMLKIASVFPFDLFPDDVTIDVNQVNIIIREFFFSERRHSVYINNISDVFVDAGLFFGTLNIVDKGFVENTISIKYLWHRDAKKARRIIQGLVVAEKQGIDVCKIDDEHLVDKIEELGKITEIE